LQDYRNHYYHLYYPKPSLPLVLTTQMTECLKKRFRIEEVRERLLQETKRLGLSIQDLVKELERGGR